MILATTTVENVDRFLEVFGTKGADKRAEHGSQGRDRVPRPDRGEPGLGAVRLGRDGLGRPSCPTPRSRRSSRRPVTSASPSPPCCSVRTGHRGQTMTHHRSAGTRRCHHRPDRRPLLHGHRQRQRGQDGDRRHQRSRRPARPPRRAVRRGQRHRRRRGAEPPPAELVEPPTSTSSSAASTARPARPSRAPWSTRRQALHLPRAVRGPGVPSADLLHRSGAGPAGRAVLPVADGADRRDAVLPAVGRLHLAADDEQEGARGRHRRGRRDRRRGVLPARPHGLRRGSSPTSWRRAPTSCSTPSSRPG